MISKKNLIKSKKDFNYSLYHNAYSIYEEKKKWTGF